MPSAGDSPIRLLSKPLLASSEGYIPTPYPTRNSFRNLLKRL